MTVLYCAGCWLCGGGCVVATTRPKAYVRVDPRLREQEWGNLQPVSTAKALEQEREKVGRFFFRFPNGESGADVYDRATSFLQVGRNAEAIDLCMRSTIILV